MRNDAIDASEQYKTEVEKSKEYVENFDILETFTNVGNDEVFTPVEVCQAVLKMLPDEVWKNPNYKWLNPCDKNGVFLREIALKLDEGLKDTIPDVEKRRKHIMQDMLYSFGLTKFTAMVSRRTNYYCSTANRKNDGQEGQDGHTVNGYSIGNGTWFDTPEGNILTPNTEHTFDKKGECIYCHTKKGGRYTDPTQNEHYAYEFIHSGKSKLEIENHLQDRFFKGDRNMKFDIIIGNPPYQLANGTGAHTNSSAIYPLFVEAAKTLKPKYLCMIIPSKWMTGGMAKGLNEFREDMLKDDDIKIIYDYANGRQVFPKNENKGGVLYFLREEGHHGLCEYHNIDKNGKETISTRSLSSKNAKTGIRYIEMEPILDKVKENSKHGYFIDKVSSIGPYGLIKEKMDKSLQENSNDNFLDNPLKEDDIKILGLDLNGTRVWKWIPKENDILKKNPNLDKYKIFISESYKSGTFGETMSDLELGKPGSGCTQTFLEIGPFETEIEAKNCIKYMKTKFFRALVGLIKTTQHGTRKVYSYVPLPDTFSNDSMEINWDQSIDSICEQFYVNYNLEEKDIEFIENNVDVMD